MDNAWIPTLQRISAKQWAALEKKIKRANGKVIVLVHPFYNDKGGEKYAKTIAGLLTQAKTPVIILEDIFNTGKTGKRLREMNAPKHLIIATARNDSEIILKMDSIRGTPRYDNSILLFAKKLKRLGVRQVQIGGMESKSAYSMDVFEHEAKTLRTRKPTIHTISQGCVGAIYKDLIRLGGFERVILVSNAVYPEKPRYKRVQRKRAPKPTTPKRQRRRK
ncbi:MAG: hypothetical protein JW772_01285 [Candidatus Diapherotrites archaeon]|nr:hypothetical protein [Candidatus Diapherotrites archaeon]